MNLRMVIAIKNINFVELRFWVSTGLEPVTKRCQLGYEANHVDSESNMGSNVPVKKMMK